MQLEWIATGIGGIGLFLLGVRLMSEGLKVAAGRALGDLLRRATASRWRALLTGFGLTAVVQSSSAVTVATIGFVNAGLLGLGQALWVVFGSNVGSSMTGWLVALTGVDLDVQAYALPMIGLGSLVRAIDKRRRLGAFAEAVAGLGLVFLGISILGEAFGGLADTIDLSALGTGFLAHLGLFVAGVVLTVVMQSSSAAIAVTLSAATSGVVDLQGAGAMVIGANLGTTSTALVAAIGATPAARRTAAGHVVFNLLAGVAALALLPWLLELMQLALRSVSGGTAISPTLALFHTAFNVLGVVMVWPIAGWLERTLSARWVSKDEERSAPRFLDHTVLMVPEVGIAAVAREMERLGRHAGEIVAAAMAEGAADAPYVESAVLAYGRLGESVSAYIADLARQPFAEDASRALTKVLKARRHFDTAVEQARSITELREGLAEDAAPALMKGELGAAMREVVRTANMQDESFSVSACEQAFGRMEERYERQSAQLLDSVTRGEHPVRAAVAGQLFLAECRRAVKDLVRGAEELSAAAVSTRTE